MADQAAAAPASAFGAGTKRKAETGDKPEVVKRHQLKNLDTAAAKLLDPYGVSLLDDVDLETLWGVISKGDHYAKFFSELAASESNCPDPVYRVGIGVSRFAQTLETAIETWLAQDELRAMMLPAVVKRIDLEANALLPHVKVLNIGKGGPTNQKGDTLSKLKAQRASKDPPKAPPAQGALETAAEKLLEFLGLGTKSNLGMALSNLSTGGIFYSASAQIKTARAWAAHAEKTGSAVDKAYVVKCIKERASVSNEPAASRRFERERATGDLLKK